MNNENFGNIDWHLLKSFLMVMEAGSLLDAAKKSGIPQPTLSRHISELEKQMATVLFERTGRALHPTAMAKLILLPVREMSDAYQRVALSVVKSKKSLTGSVRVSCSEVMAAFLMPAILTEFRKKFPSIQVEMVSTNMVSNLISREADIALRFVWPEQSSLIAKKVCDISFGVYASAMYYENIKSDLLKESTEISLENIFQFDVIGLDADKAIIDGLQEYGKIVNREAFALRTDDQVAGIMLVKSGAGIGFMPNYVAVQFPDIVPIIENGLSQTWPLWLVAHREVKSNPVVKIMYDFLAQEIPQKLRY